MSYTTKDFRKNNYFVLYDMNDNLICYFDNYKELANYTRRPLKKIAFSFSKLVDFIYIVIDNQRYKLYTYVD